MTKLSKHRPSSFRGIADSLVAARAQGRNLRLFPGLLPVGLEDAYAIQAQAIELMQYDIAGWKVGRLTPALADRFGTDRFIGPVFSTLVENVDGRVENDFPVYPGGSAAFEAEYVAILGDDQPAVTREFTPQSARMIIGDLRIGIEIAGSPLAAMPDLDSLASIADLGNNNGQIIGPAVPVDLLDQPTLMTCATSIDGSLVRAGNAADLPGGPLEAIAFALSQAAKLGRPLRAGQFISTGAVTGMHWIGIGQRCVADFGPWGRIRCLSVPIGRA
ncbi:fumarylacetoacetate hydrolase family protein [Sphingobium sp.]|uniref:2-keto-4-pentenoate hydratase n=1 Tax=Sphingobium sp. TaxID=1912891 RepID=UPI0028BE5478|nr:fumarylacetoacetate hydrolase family protein [Sphingobium sp.]